MKSPFNKGTCLQVCNFIKETPTLVPSCEYCEIFKNIGFEESLRTVASRPGTDVLSLYCFFKKGLDKSKLCLVPSITKEICSYSLGLGQQPLIALRIQNFHESISINHKIIGNFFNSKLFLQYCQKLQIRQKIRTNFNLTTDPVIPA